MVIMSSRSTFLPRLGSRVRISSPAPTNQSLKRGRVAYLAASLVASKLEVSAKRFEKTRHAVGTLAEPLKERRSVS